VSILVERVAVRYRQKGKALRKRRQQYRRTKAESKRKSKLWRQKHPAKVRRYQQHKRLHPNMHKLRRRAGLAVTLAEEAPFWDLDTNEEGAVEAVLPEDDQVKTWVDGEERTYDLFDFLDSTAFMTEESEQELFELLDRFYEGEESEHDEMAERVARRYARRKLPKSVLISAVVQFRHEGKLVTATVERTNWLGGDRMMYYWRTSDGRRIETLGLPDDLVVLDKGH
jgi:hypothetical protein